ncbi:Diguanylate cyclase/phosphodiesterase with PAS/PAC sensor(S) [Burkholderiales bacterium]|nr:Diguanylate cyclase/phosphodiesterase with PAS/PAC sensor(S) [Burkholderiales bacterium]
MEVTADEAGSRAYETETAESAGQKARSLPFEQVLGLVPESSRITSEIVRQLFSASPVGIGAAVLCALICTYVERAAVPLGDLLAWVILFLSVALARVGLVIAYQRSYSRESPSCHDWLRWLRMTAMGTGLTWGLAAILLFPPDDLPRQMILTAFLAGAAAAGALSNSADAVGASGFAICVIAPFVTHMLVREGDFYKVQGVFGLLYLGYIIAMIREVSRRTRENLVLRFEAAHREETLQLSTEQYRLLLNHLAVGVLHYGTDYRISYCNERLPGILRTSMESLIGRDVRRLSDRMILSTLERAMKEGVSVRYEGYHHATLGEFCGWISLVATPSRDGRGNIIGGVAIVEDITEHHTSQDEIRRLVFSDMLTGLPNRRMLLDRLKQALITCGRTGNYSALLFVDLDNFKTLNDTRGHDVGDQLLKQVAVRLTDCVRPSDSVARFGGDEFLVLLDDLRGDAEQAAARARKVGEKILAALNQTYMLSLSEHYCTASIGATIFGDRPVNEEELLKQADLAMYQAKAGGRNTLRFFDPMTQSAIAAQSALEADLRVAIRDRQLVLHYQPVVDSSRQVIGAEALVRWNHPARGLITPNDFIGVAELSGLIIPLGRWVLQTACAQLASWACRPERADLTLAVNISALQIRQADFVPEVLAIVQQCGADPKRLKLELTESLFVDDVEDTIAKMTALAAKGIGFSLDDFGTGYSSLSYLKRLPLDQLKIDRSFVSGLESDDSDASICAATIGLAHNLGLKVVAEGVETDVQCYFLNTVHRCDFLQGYFFGKPLPLDEFEQHLNQV